MSTNVSTESLDNPFELAASLAYQPNAVVSRTFAERKSGTITLFAFGAGQGLSEHKAPFDAFVLILDGRMEITIDGKKRTVEKGQALVMPADRPHALLSPVDSKMLLVMMRE
jgi:quercetin dioxygenase-like cupin family protein